ncbi:hypothetical protein B484DRAFT_440828, partial [Ochromonadaceae sp. CCMP2298]
LNPGILAVQKARIQSESLQALAEDASVGYVGTEGSWRSRGSLGRSADVGVATEEEEEGEGSGAEAGTEELCLHSPYESLLPPIQQSSTASVSASPTETKRRAQTSRGTGSSSSSSTSTPHSTFSSYLQREVMRKQSTAQTLNETILYRMILLLAVVGALAFLLCTLGQMTTIPTRAAIILSLEAVFTAILGYYWLGEHLNTVELVGCGLMFAATVISTSCEQSTSDASDTNEVVVEQPITQRAAKIDYGSIP